MEENQQETQQVAVIIPDSPLEEKKRIDPMLIMLAKYIKQRLKQDWDLVIAITGEQGVGKSTIAIILAQLIDKKFDFERNMSFIPSADEIAKKFNELPQYSAYVIDEAIRSLYKLEWYNVVQQAIVKMYQTERYQNKATIIVIPRFRDLTENFRNQRVNIWINIMKRGSAVAYRRDKDKDIKDPWHFDENIKKKEARFKNKNLNQIRFKEKVYFETKLKNYLLSFNYDDLSPELKERYTQFKLQSREEAKAHNFSLESNSRNSKADETRAERYKKERDTIKERAFFAMKEKGVVKTMAEMEAMFETSSQNLKNITNETRAWVHNEFPDGKGLEKYPFQKSKQGYFIPLHFKYGNFEEPVPEIYRQPELTKKLMVHLRNKIPYLRENREGQDDKGVVLPT